MNEQIMRTNREQQSPHRLDMLTPELRELLFCNVMLSIEDIKRIANTLASDAPEVQSKRAKLIQQLKLNIVSQRKAAAESTDYQNELCDKAKAHIEAWRQELAPLVLGDVLKLSHSYAIPCYKIVERELISPNAIFEMLRTYVIGQDEYISKLSLAFYTHYLRTFYPEEFGSLPQPSLLVFGPTGSGKTYAVQMLSKLFQIPFGIAHCNTLVPTGIIGRTLPDVFTQIYQQHNNSVTEVEKSIILVDEIDKINDKVINEFLSLMDDDGHIVFNDTHGCRPTNSLCASTKGMLFIYTGVFDQLHKVVEKRLNLNRIGFTTSEHKGNEFYHYAHVTMEDFLSCNIKPELLGRIRDSVYVQEHTPESITTILTSSAESPLQSYQNYFSRHGISLTIPPCGAAAIADLVVQKQLGVRGLKSFLWQILSREMMDTTTKREIILNQEYINTTTYEAS